MASTITNYSNQINTAFPVAGADNDSKTFRTNSASIQNAFGVAANEISNLQLYSIDPINNPNPNYNFNVTLNGVVLQNSALVANNSASTSTNNGVTVVDYTAGSLQQLSVSKDTLLSVSNWPPAGNYGALRILVSPKNTGTMISFDASQSSPPGTIRNDISPISYSSTSTATIAWDLFSSDGGANVFVSTVGLNYGSVNVANTSVSSGINLGVNGLTVVSGLTGIISGSGGIVWSVVNNIVTIDFKALYGTWDTTDTNNYIEYTGLPSYLWPAATLVGGFGATESAVVTCLNSGTVVLGEMFVYGPSNSAGATAGNIRLYPSINQRGAFTGTSGLYGGAVISYSLV